MPPLRRYWPLYSTIGILITLGFWLYHHLDIPNAQGNVQVLAGGVVMAFVSLIATMGSQWHAARTQHTLNALLALRTDREYLIAANKLRGHQRLGEPLNDAARAALEAERIIKPATEKRGDPAPTFNPTFAEAVDFVLNQNEFLAAGVREGAMDMRLLEATQRGVVLGLGKTFQDYIRDVRAKSPRTWENLVLLHHRFAARDPVHKSTDLGALPDRLVYWRTGYPREQLYPGHHKQWPWDRPGSGW